MKKTRKIIASLLCAALMSFNFTSFASETGRYALQALNSEIDTQITDTPPLEASPEIQYADTPQTEAPADTQYAAAPTAAPASTEAPEETEESGDTSEGDKEIALSRNYKSFMTMAKYIEELYIDDSITADDAMLMGVSKLVEGNDDMLWALLKAMFQSLDPWSDFFTEEEYREYVNSVNKTFYGIGVTIAQNGEYVEIQGFSEENSLAEQSGFKQGDKILRVGGTDCVGKSISEVRSLIVGELGTKVDITVLRGGEEIALVGTRTEVKTSTASGTVLDGNIGYIKIVSFGAETAYEVGTILDSFHQQEVKKLILDLRDNYGGVLSAAITIAQMLVPEGKIIDVIDRRTTTSYNSEQKNPEFDIVTLVNENTASASEVLASAIQDSGVGRLVGTTTYGKAVYQSVLPLDNGSYFKLTVGEYKTRNGRSINLVGLEPDELITNTTQNIDATRFTAFDFTTRNSIGDTGRNITAAKEKLKLLNMYTGADDNDVFTTDLQSAVIYFQSSNNLCANGVLDIPTQVRIKEEFEKIKVTVDRQLMTAYEMCGGDAEKLSINE